MNKQSPNGGIDYADWSWNPTVGCSKKDCPIRADCWARRMAKRVGRIIGCLDCEDFNPHLHLERLNEPAKLKKPSVIAVSFMGDFFDPLISAFDRARVIEVCNQAFHHTYLFLTKEYDKLGSLFRLFYLPGETNFTKNLYFGASISSETQIFCADSIKRAIPDWISFEPVPCNFDILVNDLLEKGLRIPQAIIGFKTKGRRVEVTCEKQSLLRGLKTLEEHGSAIWLKSNVINTAGFRHFNKPKWRRLIWRG